MVCLNAFKKWGVEKMIKSLSIVPILSMAFVPCAAIILSASAALYMGAPLDPIVLVTAWAIVFGIYGLNRFTDVEDMVNNPEKRLYFKNHPSILVAVISILAISVIVLLCTHRFTIVHFFMLLAGTTYSLRILPVFDKNGHVIFKRLKEIPFVKSITVALIWGNVFFTINLVLYPQIMCNNFEIILFIISFTLAVFVNTNFLDINDIAGDLVTGIPTIPAQYGIKNTLIYTMGLPSLVWLGVIIYLFKTGMISDKLTIFLLVNVLFPIFYIGGHFSKLLPRKMVKTAADSCVLVFSIGLLCLYYVRENMFF
jgi:4-hydroxybenzoate polyprenyltransferase